MIYFVVLNVVTGSFLLIALCRFAVARKRSMTKAYRELKKMFE